MNLMDLTTVWNTVPWFSTDYIWIFFLAEIRQYMMIITVYKILKESRKFCPVCFSGAHKLFIRSLFL